MKKLVLVMVFIFLQNVASASGVEMNCYSSSPRIAPYSINIQGARKISRKSKVFFSTGSLGAFPVKGLKTKYVFNQDEELVLRVSGSVDVGRSNRFDQMNFSLEFPIEATQQAGTTRGVLNYSSQAVGSGQVDVECETSV